MRSVSPAFTAATNAAESGEVLLTLVRLAHADWDEDIRLANNTETGITHGAALYIPWAFEVALPDDEDEGMPVLRWTADNVSRTLTQKMRGVRNKIDARVVWVLASSPDTIEAGPFEVELNAVEYDAHQISGVMTIEPILDEQFGYKIMSPATAPGLF